MKTLEEKFRELYSEGKYDSENLIKLEWKELIELFTIADELADDEADIGEIGYDADFAAHYLIEDDIWRRASQYKIK